MQSFSQTLYCFPPTTTTANTGTFSEATDVNFLAKAAGKGEMTLLEGLSGRRKLFANCAEFPRVQIVDFGIKVGAIAFAAL